MHCKATARPLQGHLYILYFTYDQQTNPPKLDTTRVRFSTSWYLRGSSIRVSSSKCFLVFLLETNLGFGMSQARASVSRPFVNSRSLPKARAYDANRVRSLHHSFP